MVGKTEQASWWAGLQALNSRKGLNNYLLHVFNTSNFSNAGIMTNIFNYDVLKPTFVNVSNTVLANLR